MLFQSILFLATLCQTSKQIAVGKVMLEKRNKIKEYKLSWVVPSSVVLVKFELSWIKLNWVELRLSWSWIWVETELGKYLNSSIEVFKVFNWSIWSLVSFYYFPCKIQNGRQDLERCLTLCFWTLLSTFANYVFWSEQPFYERRLWRRMEWGQTCNG